MDLLHGVRGQRLAEKAEAYDLWQEGDYVSSRPDGRRIIPDEIDKTFKRAVAKVGLAPMKSHL